MIITTRLNVDLDIEKVSGKNYILIQLNNKLWFKKVIMFCRTIIIWYKNLKYWLKYNL